MLFIGYEDRKTLVNQFYRLTSEGVQALDRRRSPVYLTCSVSEGTLTYSWGSTSKGMLGVGVCSSETCYEHSGFTRDDYGRIVEDYAEKTRQPHYTYQPQPMVSLLGIKIRNLACGLKHVLALSSQGNLYAWGDNSRC